MPPSPPERTLDQRMSALGEANRRRLRRAELKRQVRGGVIRVTDIVKDPEPDVRGLRIYDLLMAVARFGSVRTETFLAHHDISVVKTVGGLSPRQRQVIVDAFQDGVPHVEMRAGNRPTRTQMWEILNLQARVADLEAQLARNQVAA